MSKNGGVIGVYDHGGWVVVVTGAGGGAVLVQPHVELLEAVPAYAPDLRGGHSLAAGGNAAVAHAERRALRVENVDDHFLQVRRAVGPPWNMDHKLAMAAAIVTAPAAVE